MRFSGFDDEWKSFKLSEISKRITRKNKSLETDRPLTISAQYGLVDQIEYFNKIVASKSLKGYYLLNKGEFAYNKSYSNGYPFGAVKRLDDYENGAISTLYICFNTNDKMNSDLLKEYFETDKWHEEIYKIAVEGARNHGLLNVAVGDFFNTKHVLPTNNHEQEKIAKFLIEINTKIDLLENKHKAYQDFKKYLMQKIFAQELRFDFDEIRLKSISKINKGKQLNKEHMLEIGKFYVLNGGQEPSGYTDSWNTSENTITISEGGNSCGFVNFNIEKFWSGGHCYYLNKLSENIDVYYLYSYLKFIEPQIMRLRVGSGLPNIQKGDIENIKIKILPKKEQIKISNLLLSTDNKISSIESQKDSFEIFKKGLLQQMFVVQLILSLLQNKKHI